MLPPSSIHKTGFRAYYWGLYWDNGKENGNYYNGLYRVYIGYIIGGYIGIMEKKMETTILYIQIRVWKIRRSGLSKLEGPESRVAKH